MIPRTNVFQNDIRYIERKTRKNIKSVEKRKKTVTYFEAILIKEDRPDITSKDREILKNLHNKVEKELNHEI
jgi:hypothetical protein